MINSWNMLRSVAAGLILASIFSVGCQTSSPEELADLVITNANIYTVNEAKPMAKAVAVRDGRIIYVGGDAGAEAFVGENTRTLNLEGRTMTPGLIESHAHIMGVGTNLMNLDFMGVRSWEEVTRMVAEAAAEAEPGTWITGRGWHQDKWDSLPRMVSGFPTHHALSEAAPQNPVYLRHASGHMSIGNMAAMEAAGITRESIAPPGGDIIYDTDNKPTGLFNETAQGLIGQFVPEPDYYTALGLALEECARYGITSLHNAGSDMTSIQVFKDYLLENKLTTRLYVMLSGRDSALLKQYYAQGPEIGLGDNMLTIRSIKLYGDGALGSRGAWLHHPYSDDPSTSGQPTTSMDRILEVSKAGLEHGFQVCTHAIGDKANTEILDRYAQALEMYPEQDDHRFRIEHAQHLIAEDIPRFAELGVIASMQAIHMASDRPWAIDRLGKERIEEGAYVWQKLLDEGAVVINGTDAPVEPINPIPCFYASVARKTLQGNPEGGYEYDQRMTREQALHSYTLAAAYGAFEEDIKGSIEVGKLADFTVYTQDLMEVPEEKILETDIAMTILGGKVIYDAAAEE